MKPFLRLAAELELKGAVHITGDAYLKFGRFTKFSKGIGFDFDNFKPQPVFNVIRETASKLKTPITDEEMFKTFNMGWGFAVIVNKTDADKAVDILEKTEQGSEQIGHVSNREGIRILYKNKRIILN